MAPDADDLSDSSASVYEDDSATMAEQKVERDSSDDKSVGAGGGNNKDSKGKSKSQDADRPKRKKARRACYACQRAHLTCGDERPCLRCVKRGLAEHCHDGVRKKAKYLHDAPPEALAPPFPGSFHPNGAHVVAEARQMSSNSLPATNPSNYYNPAPSSSYPPFTSVGNRSSMGGPIVETVNPLTDYAGLSHVQAPNQFFSNSPQQVSPVQSLPASLDQSSTMGNTNNASFDAGFLDSDPTLFTVNPGDVNFENHYGASEFTFLGQLSSNAPEVDPINSLARPNPGNVAYDGSGFSPPNYPYGQPLHTWQTIPRHNSSTQLWNLNNNNATNNNMDGSLMGDHAGSVAGTSDYSQGHDFAAGYNSAAVSPDVSFAQPNGIRHPSVIQQGAAQQASSGKRKQAPTSDELYPPSIHKKRKTTSDIYDGVQSPHPYTQGFHNLINFLNKRFPSSKVLRIAKALASFRPSFISCNKNLTTDDLIFMEQCFQRTLHEYDDFLEHTGTPTIICRRTGEVATVNKEFSLVTGWRSDVLLGKAPNLNVNVGSKASGTETGYSSRGTVTPRVPAGVDIDPGRPQPVFLAELMDQDSVVQFYEDFAELAFGASRSSIIGARTTLHKYKTKDDDGWGSEGRAHDDRRGVASNAARPSESLMKGSAGTDTLGDNDGKLDAVLCWTVKRDVFDIPMMIIINFLPII